jgi:serine/threonine protein phosphatase PrpC
VSRAATCPTCGEHAYADERFCEACGHPLPLPSGLIDPAGPGLSLAALAATAMCPTCGASGEVLGADGTCGRCGHRWTPLGEHRELAEGPVAAVTDRGRTHWRNEDAVGLRWVPPHHGGVGSRGGFVLVVADGVSVSQEPHLVSQAAVDGALPVLERAVTAGVDLRAAVVDATAAAQAATAALPYDPTLDVGPGACTFVAAAVRAGRVAVASVGDSRAWWVDPSGAVQLSRDDSLAGELVASGRFTVRQAMASPGAHSLTKWLGVDSTDAAPSVAEVELPGPGLVVLATDGLWNYAPDPDDMARLIGPIGAERPLPLARRLAVFASEAGGADNITVAVGAHGLGEDGR